MPHGNWMWQTSQSGQTPVFEHSNPVLGKFLKSNIIQRLLNKQKKIRIQVQRALFAFSRDQSLDVVSFQLNCTFGSFGVWKRMEFFELSKMCIQNFS